MPAITTTGLLNGSYDGEEENNVVANMEKKSIFGIRGYQEYVNSVWKAV